MQITGWILISVDIGVQPVFPLGQDLKTYSVATQIVGDGLCAPVVACCQISAGGFVPEVAVSAKCSLSKYYFDHG